MPILFASTSDADFAMTGGTMGTPSSGWDTAYTPNILRPVNYGVGSEVMRLFTSTLGIAGLTDFWVQFRVRWDRRTWFVGTPPLLCWDNVLNRNIFRFRPPEGGWSATGVILQYWNGSAWVDIGTRMEYGFGVVYTFGVRCKIDATAGELSWYVNGAKMGEFVGNTLFASGLQARAFAWGSSGDANGGATENQFGEILITDATEDPWGMRVATLTPNAAGTHSDWTGSVADINETTLNTATALLAGSTGLTSTFGLSDVAAGVTLIRAVRVSALARAGATGPQGIKMAARVNGALHTGPTVALTGSLRTVAQTFDVNPATGADFTASEVNAMEAGVQSA